MEYGCQPTEFITHWRNMYTTVKSLAPDTSILWSPSGFLFL